MRKDIVEIKLPRGTTLKIEGDHEIVEEVLERLHGMKINYRENRQYGGWANYEFNKDDL